MFVAATNGSLTLFENDEALKTINLSGEGSLVRLINGEIVTAAQFGKVTVLNEKLRILKTFHGSERFLSSLTGNRNYIAFGDYNGTVRYYDRVGSFFPRVSGWVRTLKPTYRYTTMKKKYFRWTCTMSYSSVVRKIVKFKFGT